MEKVLKLSLEMNKPVIIMYMGKNGISKRKIQVLSIEDDKVLAYCYLREKNRSFIISNILSAQLCE